MRVVFLGRTQLLMKTIERFEKTGHEIVGIGTCTAVPEYTVTEKDFEDKAKKLKIPFFCDAKINSSTIQQRLVEMQADIAISINWLTIINEQTIGIFKYGILNGHCGDLPKYRGNACPNWAIINGEECVGVSVHFMESSQLDSGDIVVKKYVDILNNTTIGEVYHKMEEILPEMFIEAVEKIAATGKLAGMPQSKEKNDILRCYPRIPGDSCIDWRKTCTEIDRLIRASSDPFQGAYSYINGKSKIYVQKARISDYEFPSVVVFGQVIYRDYEKGEVGIAAKDGVIILEEVSDEEHITQNAAHLIRSARDRLGMMMQDEIYELRKEINELKCRIVELEND